MSRTESPKCANCFEPGHWTVNCPHVPTNPERTELDIFMLDYFSEYAPVSREGAKQRLLAWHATLVEQAVLEARLDEVRIGSDMHQLMRRIDRIAWSNSRYQELESQRREGGK